MVLGSGRWFWPVESGFNLLEAILSFSKRNMIVIGRKDFVNISLQDKVMPFSWNFSRS